MAVWHFFESSIGRIGRNGSAIYHDLEQGQYGHVMYENFRLGPWAMGPTIPYKRHGIHDSNGVFMANAYITMLLPLPLRCQVQTGRDGVKGILDCKIVNHNCTTQLHNLRTH